MDAIGQLLPVPISPTGAHASPQDATDFFLTALRMRNPPLRDAILAASADPSLSSSERTIVQMLHAASQRPIQATRLADLCHTLRHQQEAHPIGAVESARVANVLSDQAALALITAGTMFTGIPQSLAARAGKHAVKWVGRQMITVADRSDAMAATCDPDSVVYEVLTEGGSSWRLIGTALTAQSRVAAALRDGFVSGVSGSVALLRHLDPHYKCGGCGVCTGAGALSSSSSSAAAAAAAAAGGSPGGNGGAADGGSSAVDTYRYLEETAERLALMGTHVENQLRCVRRMSGDALSLPATDARSTISLAVGQADMSVDIAPSNNTATATTGHAPGAVQAGSPAPAQGMPLRGAPVGGSNQAAKLKLLDGTAAAVAQKFADSGDVQQLYAKFCTRTNAGGAGAGATADDAAVAQRGGDLLSFLEGVDAWAKQREETGRWLRCADSVSSMTSQVALASKSRDMARFSAGVGATVNAVSGFREFSNGQKLLSAATQAGALSSSLVAGFTSVFSGVGLVLGAVGVLSSLFGRKERASSRPDFSAATYSAVMAMWGEMRNGFTQMQQRFDEVASQVGYMSLSAESNHLDAMEELYRTRQSIEAQIDRLAATVGDGVARILQTMARVQLDQRKQHISLALMDVMRTVNDAMVPPATPIECLGKMSRLVGAFGESGSQHPAFSGPGISEPSVQRAAPPGTNVAPTPEASSFARAVEAIDHPAFFLTSLLSYARSVLPVHSVVYTRSQMGVVVRALQSTQRARATGAGGVANAADVRILDPVGIESIIPAQSGRTTLSVRPVEQLLSTAVSPSVSEGRSAVAVVPVEFCGSWVVLVYGDGPTVQGLRASVSDGTHTSRQYFMVLGLSEMTALCAGQLAAVCPNVRGRERAFPTSVAPNNCGAYAAHLMDGLSRGVVSPSALWDGTQSPPAPPATFVEDIAAVVVAHNGKFPLPTVQEQTLGNPLLDWWICLGIERLLAVFHDDPSHPHATVPDDVLNVLASALGRVSGASQLSAIGLDGRLHDFLLDRLAGATESFARALDAAAMDAADRQANGENARVHAVATSTEGVLRSADMAKENLGADIKPRLRFEGSNMFTGGYQGHHHYATNTDIIPGSGFSGTVAFDATERRFKDAYELDRKKDMDEIVIATAAAVNAVRRGFQVTHSLRDTFLGVGTPHCALSQGIAVGLPTLLVPAGDAGALTMAADSPLPYLRAPRYLFDVLPPSVATAMQLGLVRVRFTYQLSANRFIISGEWAPVTDVPPMQGLANTWIACCRRSLPYTPLFYTGAEAVFGFWYGGRMPVTQNGVHHYTKSACNPAQTCTDRIWVYIPQIVSRPAAVATVDVRALTEELAGTVVAGQCGILEIRIAAWTSGLQRRTSAALADIVRANQDLSCATPLATSLQQMGAYMHLLEAYNALLVMAFPAHASRLTAAMQLPGAYFDTAAVLGCLSDPARGVAALRRFAAERNQICARLRVQVRDAVAAVARGSSLSAFADTSLLLRSRIVERLPVCGRRLPWRRERIGTLDRTIDLSRRQLEQALMPRGDPMFHAALRQELARSAEVSATLRGQLAANEQHEAEANATLHDLLPQLDARVGAITREHNRVVALVSAGIVNPNAAHAIEQLGRRLLDARENVARAIQYAALDGGALALFACEAAAAAAGNASGTAADWMSTQAGALSILSGVPDAPDTTVTKCDGCATGNTPLRRSADTLRAELGRLERTNDLAGLQAVLDATGADGSTLLHEAVKHDDYELAVLLLSYRPTLTLRNGDGLTAEELLEHMAEVEVGVANAPSNGRVPHNRPPVELTAGAGQGSALDAVAPRGAISDAFAVHHEIAEASSAYGVAIHRLLFLLGEGVKHVNSIAVDHGVPAVFVHGRTGTGKTTLVSYLGGCTYARDLDLDAGTDRMRLLSGTELGTVGHCSVSETLYPGVYPMSVPRRTAVGTDGPAEPTCCETSESRVVVVDLAGVGDNRESGDEAAVNHFDVVSAVCMQYLASAIGAVGGIIVTVTEDDVMDARGDGVLVVARQIGRVLKAGPDQMKSRIALAVTKSVRGLRPAGVASRLSKIVGDHGGQSNSDDGMDLRAFCDALCTPEGQSRIVCVDESGPETRTTLMGMFGAWACSPIDMAALSFASFSRSVEHFRGLVDHLSNKRHIRQMRRDELEAQCAELRSAVAVSLRTGLLHAQCATALAATVNIADGESLSAMRGIVSDLLVATGGADLSRTVDGWCGVHSTVCEAERELRLLERRRIVEYDLYRGLDSLVNACSLRLADEK